MTEKKKVFEEWCRKVLGIQAQEINRRDLRLKPITLNGQQSDRLKAWHPKNLNWGIVIGVEASEVFFKGKPLNQVRVWWKQTPETGMALFFPKDFFNTKMIGGAQ